MDNGAEDSSKVDLEIAAILSEVKHRDPHQKEFHQALEEVFKSLRVVFLRDGKYLKVMRRLVEPDRLIQFRVVWIDDKGQERVNRGFRVQFCNAIGPYKGGLRFHPSVNASIVKFLGFEQIFKNALTTLPLGGGKGGSDFDPKGKSDREIMAFCQSFMTELFRYIGPNTDIPAGDMGVGAREIGFMFGQWRRLTSEFSGALTGKGLSYGGSLIRREATGYGLLYFLENLLTDSLNTTIEGKRVLISGSGNVAQFAAKKAVAMGACVLTLSDSSGFVEEPQGFTDEQLDWILELKNKRRGRLLEYGQFSSTAIYHPGKRPWGVSCDVALPCATQNELELEDARHLCAGGCKVLCEGANMPTTAEAIAHLMAQGVIFAPAKACNAGGVATSGLEMSQNSHRMSLTAKEVDDLLKGIMQKVYSQTKQAAAEFGQPNNFMLGATVAGFRRVADAMIAQGSV